MTDDELVERLAAGLYQCHGHSTLVRDGSGSDWVCDGDSHSPDCPVTEKPAAMALAREVAAAVREAVMASAEVCRGRCGGRGHVLNSLDSVEPTSPCPTCSGRGILFGRGVVEGET